MVSDDDAFSSLDEFFSGGPKPLLEIEAKDTTMSPASSGIDEQKVKDKRADRMLRIGMAITLTLLFVALNSAVVWMLIDQTFNDRALLAAKLIQPGDRIVDGKVYMSLIGGTVVQVAAIVVVVARYLFPSRDSNN